MFLRVKISSSSVGIKSLSPSVPRRKESYEERCYNNDREYCPKKIAHFLFLYTIRIATIVTKPIAYTATSAIAISSGVSVTMTHQDRLPSRSCHREQPAVQSTWPLILVYVLPRYCPSRVVDPDPSGLAPIHRFHTSVVSVSFHAPNHSS